MLMVPGLVVHILLLLIAANRTSLFLTVLLGFILFCVFASRLLVSLFIVAVSIAGTAYVTCDPGWTLAGSAFGDTTTYVSRGQDTDFSDLSGRREMWEVMWGSYRQSPWIGHGHFVSSETGEIYVWYEWTNWTAHNVVLQALVTTGLVGASLLACGVGSPFFRLLRSRRADSHTRKLFHLVLIVGAWFVLWGFFNSSFLGPIEPESVAFFTTFGLAAGHASSATCQMAPRRSSGQRASDTFASSHLAGS